MNSTLKKTITVSITFMLVAAFFLAPTNTTTVYASDPYLDNNVPTAGMTNKDIEYMNQHELSWMVNQNKVFKDAFTLEAPFQKLIDRMVKRHGQIPVLDVALGTYDTSFLQAQKVQVEAATVIGKQYGFDAQGHVRNREAALATVTSGRESLRNARLQLLVSIRALHRSYNAWRHLLITHDK